MITDGRYDSGNIGRITIHIIQNAPRHDSTRLRVIFSVDQVTNIVQIAGDLCQFNGMVVVAHSLKNIPGDICRMDYMCKAVFRKAKRYKRLVCTGYICSD